MREFLLDSDVKFFRKAEVVFQKNAIGSSLFGIASGHVLVEIAPKDPKNPDGAKITVATPKGSITGEVGLISGRRRGATVRAGEDSILVEIPRRAALKLMAQVAEARETVNRITTERQILQIFKSGLTPADLSDVVASAEVVDVKAGQAIMNEGEIGDELFIIRSGSMIVEKQVGGKQVFLSYVPAGSYSGEMALLAGGPRTATVKAAIRSQVVRLPGEPFRRLLAKKPELAARMRAEVASRRKVNAFVEARKDNFRGVADMYSSVASLLIDQAIG